MGITVASVGVVMTLLGLVGVVLARRIPKIDVSAWVILVCGLLAMCIGGLEAIRESFFVAFKKEHPVAVVVIKDASGKVEFWELTSQPVRPTDDKVKQGFAMPDGGPITIQP